MSMDINEISTAMVGMANALKTIESAIELKMQTSRIRNVLSGHDLDEMMGNSVVALRKLNERLREELTKDEE